ncbi:MAG: transcription elongation factor GreA [Patescibacteria group bacterium]|nr:transcription elongation factor GreA [Patescibacteria group bacterium]
MTETKQYLTRERYDALKTELDELKTKRRKEVAENLEYAKKLGDLSENAEYHEARERQAEVEDRIQYIENMLKSASIVQGDHGDVVEIGSTVSIVRDNESDMRIYSIVSSEEADSASGKLSNISPLGAALLGKKCGDTIKVKTPKGMVSYVIKEIK